MAQRRMFSKKITNSDAFLDMPLSTQCLYFHLNMEADDDGFVNAPKKVMRLVGASEDDINLLIMKSFVIAFESGVVVIKHWKIHNYIAKDRYKETSYLEEKSQLTKKENGAYSLMHTDCIQDVYNLETQDRLGKVSKDIKELKEKELNLKTNKNNKVEVKTKETNKTDKNNIYKRSYGVYKNVNLSDDEVKKLYDDYGVEAQEFINYLDAWIEEKGIQKKQSRRNHYLTIKRWVIDAVKEKQAKTRKLQETKRVDILPSYEAENKIKLDEGRLQELMERRKDEN